MVQVDIIVVYKVDRLTRSLLDFSKLVEALDKAGISFVSVAQSFNTTTSMGRLSRRDPERTAGPQNHDPPADGWARSGCKLGKPEGLLSVSEFIGCHGTLTTYASENFDLEVAGGPAA